MYSINITAFVACYDSRSPAYSVVAMLAQRQPLQLGSILYKEIRLPSHTFELRQS